jgi:HEPN domain-containing protein
MILPDLEMAREFARRAKEDLRSSRVLLENGLYADSVYHAQQAAEKIVKSILLLNDIVTEQLVASHFVSVVVSRSPDEWSEKLSEIAKDLIDLEKEWLRSRYPMRKFGKLVIPSSLYDLKKAEELYEKAKKILEIVAAYAEEVYGVRLID